MNAVLEQVNSTGKAFVEFAVPMLVQSGVLIVILLLLDLALRKKVKAVFRYCIWMLVLLKLILPTSLSSPLSLGYWFGDHLAYVAESRTSAAPEAEALEPALADMLHIIEPVPVEEGRPTPAVLPMMPDVETSVTEAIGPPTVLVTPVTWQGVVFLVWLAVVTALGLLLLQRAMFVRGLVAQAKEANALMNDALEYCRKCMGVKRKIGLKVSANATSPAVCGLFRPVILLPHKLAPSLGSRGLRAVLLHELAHIRRGDLWVNLVQTVLQIGYFYNPLLWAANCVIRRVREQAIDETVLVAMGEKAQQYPQTLVNVAKLAFKRPVLSLRLIGVVESKSALAGRIKHILNRPMPKSAKVGVLGLAAVLIIGAILLPMAKAAQLTDHTRQIMKLAKQEARQLNHEYIGTEHILLALVKEGRGVSGIVLRKHDVNIEKVRSEVRKLVRSGPEVVVTKKLPKTPRAKRAMKYAKEEAKVSGHDYIGAEHILLGLLREKDGVAAQVLMKLGLKLEDARQEVLNVVGPKPKKGGYPTLVISGVVTDLATGNPIVGAKVGDDGYGPKPYRSAVTGSDGRYYYLTWPEHHGIKAQAAGYKVQRKSLYEGHFTFNKEMVEEVYNFALEADRRSGYDHFVGKYAVAGHPDKAAFEITKKGSVFIFSDLGGPKFEMGIILRGLEGRKFEMEKGEDNLKFGDNRRDRFRVRYDASENRYILDKLGMRGEVQDAVTWQLTELVKLSAEKPADIFAATLPNGVTVELVGVTNHYIQSERPVEQAWWSANGLPLESQPYAKLGWSAITDYRNSSYEFAIRIDGQEEYTCAAETSLSRSRRLPNIPKTKNDESLPNMRAFIGDFRKEDKEGNIRFGVAISPWHEVEVWRDGWIRGGETSNVSTHSESSVVYEWPRQDGNKVVIEVTHTLANEDRRLLIVDKDGKIHIGDSRKFMGEGAGIVRDIYYFHNFNRKDMEVLKFEKRPYEWVEFKNVSLRPGHKTDVQVEVEEVASAAAFEELSVKFGGIWHWQEVEFTVRGDGSVEFSINTAPNDKTRYRTAFKLSGEHLAELSGLLRRTNWLTAPGANVQPRFSDATRIDMKLVREGKTNEVWCHDRNAEPYLSLIIFLKRIHRQEYLLYQMTVPGATGRNSAFSDVYQQIRAEKGEPVSAHPHRILDFSRFIRPSVELIGHPDENHYETVAIAVKILGKLKAEQVRPQITDLTTAERKKHYDIAAVVRTEHIRAAAVEALTELGGEQARLHVRDMAKNHRSWRRVVNEAIVESLLELDKDNCAELLKDMAAKTREASWGLIRLGPTGMPAILEILEVRDIRYMGQIYLIRQYIDRWQEVTKPIDPRVIEAVQRNLDYRLGYGPTWTQYHKELLRLAGAPELPGKDARQIAEEFLAAVKANDQMKIGAIAHTRGGNWPQRLAKLKGLPGLQQLKVTEVYADKDGNIGMAVALDTSREKGARVSIYLNFLSNSVWRVVNIAVERPEIGDRMTRRFLESHPNAKPVPAKASSVPGVKKDVGRSGKSTESKGAESMVEEASEHAGRISGIVVSSATGEPVSGAYVGVGDFGDSGGSNYSRHRSQGFHDKTETDEKGRFELEGLVFTDDHPYLKNHPLVVTHPDFVRHDEEVELLKDEPVPDIKISLRPAARIDLTIVDADGNPLEGHWLLRLEALDGRRFIPPGQDRHLSSFTSSVWLKQPDLRRNMGTSEGFSFTELDTGEYSIEAIRFHLVDNPTPQNIWKPTVTYHGSIPSLKIQAGQAKDVQIKPANHQTSVAIKIPEDPYDKREMPPFIWISRRPAFLLDTTKVYHPEDSRLGRLTKSAYFHSTASPGDVFTIKNLPAGSYSVFAVYYGKVPTKAVFKTEKPPEDVRTDLIGPAIYVSKAKVEVSQGRETTVKLPPINIDCVGIVKTWTLDRRVKLEARQYSVKELCALLTSKTESNPRFIADSSIEDAKLRMGEGEMSIWDLLETICLQKGWKILEGEEKTLILRPGDKTGVDLTLSQGREGSVTGTVRFHGTGAPASEVVVKTVSKWFDTVQARTDQQGSYTLAGIRPEAVFHITAEDEQKELYMIDMPAAVLKPGEAKTGVDLTVYQGRKGSISGKVVGRRIFYKKPERLTRNIVPENFERRQDSPLAGVKIVLKSNKGVVKETITDETGRYRFEGLHADGYVVRAELPQGAAFDRDNYPSLSRYVKLESEPRTDVDLHFRLDGISIAGRVTDTNGNPIGGAKVVAEFYLQGEDEGMPVIKKFGSPVMTLSAADGRYRLDGLCPVTFSETATYLIHGKLYRWYEMRVQAKGYSPAMVLVPPVTEHLVGETSRLMEDYKGLYGERDSSSAEVALPKSRGNAVTGIDFVLQKAAVITGRVLDTQGNIVPGPRQKALVRMVPVDSRDDKKKAPLLQTPGRIGLDWIALDEAGRFKFDGVGAGSYFFEIRTGIDPYDTQRARNETLVVKAGEVIKDLDIIVESIADRGNISGRVLDALSGKPVEAFSVWVSHVNSPEEPTPARGRATTDKSQKGVFLIEGISPGTATLEILASGYVPKKTQVKVASGQTTDMTFHLEQRGKISGRVLDALSGKPVKAFSARVTRVDSSGEGTPALGWTTIDKSQEGAFLIEDISTGTATLQILAPGYAREKVQVKVVSGQTSDMSFHLEQEGKLQVYITLNGKGQMAWSVSARPAGEGPDAEISTQMGKEGRYELTGLKEAEYLVRAPVPLSTGIRGRATVQINNRARVKIEPGKETRLDFELRDNAGIRGTFTGPDKDLSWRILIFDDSAAVRDDSVSEVRQAHALIWKLEQGKHYEIRCLPAGTYRVVGRCCKKDQGWTAVMEKSKTVTVGAGQVAEVDFVFP